MSSPRIALVLLCCALVFTPGCGTFLDFTEEGGPHIYGGVSTSVRTLGRRSLIDNPFIYLFSIIDVPLCVVTDTIMLPVSATIGSSERDPKVVNNERKNDALEDVAKTLLEAMGDAKSQTIAVLDFPRKGEREGLQNPTGVDLADRLRKILASRVKAVVPAETVRTIVEEEGFTSVEETLAVRSVAEELEATALITGNFVTEEFGTRLKITISIRSAETGREVKGEAIEIKLEDEGPK